MTSAQFRRICALPLFTAAALVSAYLAVSSLLDAPVPGCGEGRSCFQVLTTKWAYLAGIPVSVFGFLLYTGLIMVALLSTRKGRPTLRSLEVLGSLVVLLGALWFTVVQLVILQSFCPWCCTAHAIASVGAILLLSARSEAGARRWSLKRSVPVAATAVLLLAAVQYWSDEPDRYLRVKLEPGDAGSPANSGAPPVSDLSINSTDLPTIGMPESESVAVALTDYTCPHCRELHRTLQAAETELAGRLAVVLVPAFRDAKARELHRIMLATWRIDPVVFAQVQDELISEELVAEPAAVLARVQEALSDEFYPRAWQHAWWVDTVMQQARSTLAANDRRLPVSTLPQLMIGDEVLVGRLSAETILEILDEGLPGGMPPALAQRTIQPDPEDAPSPNAPTQAATGTPAGAGSSTAGDHPEAPPAGTTTGSAQIEFENPQLELPEVVHGEPAIGKFVFHNRGTAPLQIKQIKTSCGCTTVAGWEKPVPPGEAGSFEVTLDTGRIMGKATKSITVTTNATNVPDGIIKVGIIADVWSPVRLTRNTASFGTVLKGKSPPPLTIQIFVTEEDPLPLSQALSSNPEFKTELTTIEEGKRYELSVVPPQLAEGTSKGTITIPLGHPKLEKIELPTQLTVADPVSINPASIELGAATTNAPSKRLLTLLCNDRALPAFEVQSVTVLGAESITTSVNASKSPRWAQIEVTIPAGFNPDVQAKPDACFLIRTNHPDYQEVRIPIKVAGRTNPLPRSEPSGDTP